MSSLGVIATSAIFMVVALVSISSFTGIILLNYNLLKNSISLASAEGALAGGRLKVNSIQILPDNRSLEALILNDGAEKIRVRDFEKMDLIIVYGSGGGVEAEWLPYDPGEELEAGWRPLNITYEGSGELLNPASPDFSSGIWDPGEVLAIRAWTRSEIGEPVKLIIVSPRGVGPC